MSKSTISELFEHFKTVKDPRVEGTKDYALLDIIVIAVCAVIGGADDWVEIEEWGNEKLVWLRQFVALENGIPSHATFGRVFSRIDAESFQAAFLGWVQSVFEISDGQIVAIDGKALRCSHDKRLGKAAIYRVSAWATDNHLTLGQRKVDDKSNEITAIPKLLEVLTHLTQRTEWAGIGHAIFLLDLPHLRLHNLPQRRSTELFLRQQPLNLVVAYPASQQSRQASSSSSLLFFSVVYLTSR